MVINLLQIDALRSWVDSTSCGTKTNRNGLRLMWFYDYLFDKFSQDVMASDKIHNANGLLPLDWMPPAMHRCLVRIEHHIAHCPDALDFHVEFLHNAYHNSKDHFSFGQ
jgi:hypothetical protein